AENGASVFYDTQGSLKDTEEVVRLLEGAIGDLSEAERNRYLQTIFGLENMALVNALVNEGVEGYRRAEQALIDMSDAEQMAADRMTNFRGVMEEFFGTLETVSIQVGRPLLDALTNLGMEVTGLMNDIFLGGDIDYESLAQPLADAIDSVAATVGRVRDALEGVDRTNIDAVIDALQEE